jgi:hypothetical protein
MRGVASLDAPVAFIEPRIDFMLVIIDETGATSMKRGSEPSHSPL